MGGVTSLSRCSLNPVQISGQEEIVLHFLTNWVKQTLSGALRKQMAPFITGGHWWRNGAWADAIAANGLTGNIRAFVDRAGNSLASHTHALSLSLSEARHALVLSLHVGGRCLYVYGELGRSSVADAHFGARVAQKCWASATGAALLP